MGQNPTLVVQGGVTFIYFQLNTGLVGIIDFFLKLSTHILINIIIVSINYRKFMNYIYSIKNAHHEITRQNLMMGKKFLTNYE